MYGIDSLKGLIVGQKPPSLPPEHKKDKTCEEKWKNRIGL
jgi:hypothetical protein